jgi:pyridoxal phosphate enzyme (YggS family)
MSTDLIGQITINLEIVKGKLIKAALKSGRDTKTIRLIVVTKSQPLNIVRAAIDSGAVLLGENYAEEGLEKIIALKNESRVEWHMIGHVQSRKADLVALNYTMLHSLDSIKLANRLERSLDRVGKELPVLLEFNVGDEESKYGWQAGNEKKWHEFLPEINQILKNPHLRVIGLMTMPPFDEDPEMTRPYFAKLRKLRNYLENHFQELNLNELSMGTSSDFEIAVEEGATYVRVGQNILGKRQEKG